MGFNDIFKNKFMEMYNPSEISFKSSIIVMGICFLLSIAVYVVYYYKSKRYFYSREFGVSIIALSIITAAVILTIQSSVVISLGMVGALSIVRFRTAIKNPLDLIFLFWSIVIGIICGAGLFGVAFGLTVFLGIIILLMDCIPSISRSKLVIIEGASTYAIKDINSIMEKHVKWLNIRSETVRNNNFTIIIEIRGLSNSDNLIKELKTLDYIDSVSIIIQEGMVD